MILNPTYYDKEILDLMQKIVDEIKFDVIKIIRINTSKEHFFEMFSLTSDIFSFSIPIFLLSNIDSNMIDILSEFKNAIILTEEATILKERTIKKHSDLFFAEIYMPVFDENNLLSGFIYYAKTNPSDEIRLSALIYINNIKHLVKLVEIKLSSLKNTEKLYDTVLLLCEIIYLNKPDMINRLYSIFYWAKEIAEKLNLSEFEIHKLQLAILMHDFGRIIIDQKIFDTIDINRTSSEVIKSYVNHSYDIAQKLKSIYEIYDIPEIVLYSMQRIDGKNYPKISSSDQIPLLSRIIYISKAVTYMLESTPHKKAYTTEKIIFNLKNNAGSIFDTNISNILIQLLSKKQDIVHDVFSGIGNYVTLNLVLTNLQQYNVWGNIRKTDNIYEFHPNDELPDVDITNIKSCDVYLILNDSNTKYSTEVISYEPNGLMLSSLTPQENENLFSLKWAVDGSILTKDKYKHDIYTTTIGGNFIDFYTFSNDSKQPITAGVISINLYHESNIYIPGIITFHQKINDKTYYRFSFHNLSEKNQQKIFSAIFKKQVEKRTRMLSLDDSR